MPTMSPMPDISEVSDYAAPIATLLGAILLFVAGLAWRKANVWFAEVIADVKATKVQTTNSHETNLRDDLTEAVTAINAVASSVDEMKTHMGDMKDSMERLDSRQTEVHEDLRETRKDLRFATEYVRDVDKRLTTHIDDGRGGTHG